MLTSFSGYFVNRPERCVDASIAVKWAVKGEPFRAKVRALLRDSGVLGIILIAPLSFNSEVDSAIRKRVFDGKMTLTEAKKGYAILDFAPIQIVDAPGVRQEGRVLQERLTKLDAWLAECEKAAVLWEGEFDSAADLRRIRDE